MTERARIEVSGANELLDTIQSMGEKGEEIGKSALDETTAIIAARARVLVPVDDYDGGDLRDSIRTTKANVTKAGRVSAGIVAGGTSLAKLVSEKGKKEPGAYALIVHEDVTMRHPNGGQAKFIEQPALEEAPKVPGRIEERLARIS